MKLLKLIVVVLIVSGAALAAVMPCTLPAPPSGCHYECASPATCNCTLVCDEEP